MGVDHNANAAQYSSLPTADAELVPNVQVEAKQLAVQVTAPSDMQEGFSLPVRIDGKDAQVVVPRGGVRAGEKFTGAATFLDGSSGLQFGSSSSSGSDGIPVGAWRHAIFDCCVHGFFHPLWIMTWCYGALPLAQVQTRMNLNLLGHERDSRTHGAPSAFRIGFILFVVWMCSVRFCQATFKLLAPNVENQTMFAHAKQTTGSHVDAAVLGVGTLDILYDLAIIAFLVGVSVWYRCFLDRPSHFRWILAVLFVATIGMDSIGVLVGIVANFEDGLDETNGKQNQNIEHVMVPGMARLIAFIHLLLMWGMRIFIVYAGTMTRSFLRRKYAIPGDGCGDCLCMFFCTCCAVVQMSTHTANYAMTPYNYGSENGLDHDDNEEERFNRYRDTSIAMGDLP
ncbi:hypothetical protein ACA910_003690 [Epithemia clementina (nom. ined.)]